jgi:hypothetical protein
MLPDEAGPRSGPFMTAADTPGSTEPPPAAHADFTKFTAYLENSAGVPGNSPADAGPWRY